MARVVLGMAGPDRAMVYRVALGTGFRAAELASLYPGSFRLDANPPTIVCEAAYTKNGQLAEQPISEALAALLWPWVAHLEADRPVFTLPDRAADMIRADLEAAGIPYTTSSGVIDFHALRATYVSHLVASGASVKVCQTLARHSTPSLTIGIYAKASVHDLAGAVEALPDLTAPTPRSESSSLARTGTDGPILAAHGQCAGDGEGRKGSVIGGSSDETTPSNEALPMNRNPLGDKASGGLMRPSRCLSVMPAVGVEPTRGLPPGGF